MNRRGVIALLSATGWRLVAGAEPAALSVVGLLGTESPETSTDRLREFREGLTEAGHVEGRNALERIPMEFTHSLHA
jgi:putative ABC transport system substrate-binding protein